MFDFLPEIGQFVWLRSEYVAVMLSMSLLWAVDVREHACVGIVVLGSVLAPHTTPTDATLAADACRTADDEPSS